MCMPDSDVSQAVTKRCSAKQVLFKLFYKKIIVKEFCFFKTDVKTYSYTRYELIFKYFQGSC